MTQDYVGVVSSGTVGQMTVVIAIDVGASKIRACAFEDGVSRHPMIRDTPSRTNDPEKNSLALVDELVAVVGAMQTEVPDATCVALSCPGIMKLEPAPGARPYGPLSDYQVTVTAVGLGLVNFQLQRALEERTEMRVHLEHDANASLRSIADGRNTILVVHGSGIGMSVFKNGQIMRIDGSWGCFEIGHGFRMPLRESLTRKCRCGATGCLEAAIGGWALADRFEVEPHEAGRNVLVEMRESVLDLLPYVMANSVDRFGIPRVLLTGSVANGFAAHFDYAAAIKQRVDARRTGYNIDTEVALIPDGESAALRGVALAAVDAGACD